MVYLNCRNSYLVYLVYKIRASKRCIDFSILKITTVRKCFPMCCWYFCSKYYVMQHLFPPSTATYEYTPSTKFSWKWDLNFMRDEYDAMWLCECLQKFRGKVIHSWGRYRPRERSTLPMIMTKLCFSQKSLEQLYQELSLNIPDCRNPHLQTVLKFKIDTTHLCLSRGMTLNYVKIYIIFFSALPKQIFGPGSSVGITTELRAGRSGDRIPVEARFSAHVQTDPGAHPASCTIGTGSFPGVKSGRGVTLTLHPLLVPLVIKE